MAKKEKQYPLATVDEIIRASKSRAPRLGDGRYLPLGGKSRNYIDSETGQKLSRRQVDQRTSAETYEQKRARNRAENPSLQQQRPARGRKSTLPKKHRKSASNRAKRRRLKNGLYILEKNFYPMDYDGMRSWLIEQYRKKGLRFRFIGRFENGEGSMGPYIVLSLGNINKAVENVAVEEGPFFVAPQYLGLIISMQIEVLFDGR